ncbi:MAG: hypothetical protein MI974_04975 [Chitinophagales bacterium]|nr:hypothetical protein [Chitinophagales bacterium]
MTKLEKTFNCPCNERIFPPPLTIPAGLSQLPRQMATFPEFRNAMLSKIRTKSPLYYWQARDEDDLGMMLLEMWAYICDSLTFYDQIIAQEGYVRTAHERSSLSKLVQLLGYIPKPALAATVQLPVLVDGRRAVSLPKDLAFRSGAFDEEPPQVFELEMNTEVHPFTNKWEVKPPQALHLKEYQPQSIYIIQKQEIEEGAIALLRHSSSLYSSQGLIVNKIATENGIDQQVYTKITFNQKTKLGNWHLTAKLKLFLPKQTASLWTIMKVNESGNITNPSVVNGRVLSVLTLDKLYEQIKPGQDILVSRPNEYRVFKVKQVRQVMREPNPLNRASINGTSYDIPSISIPVTQISLDTTLNNPWRLAPTGSTGNWTNNDREEIQVHFAMENAGNVVNLPSTRLSYKNPILLKEKLEPTLNEEAIRNFILEDLNLDSTAVAGSLKLSNNQLKLNQGENWKPAFYLPVHAYGNIVEASRGETVKDEIIGIGDASMANQRFKLQKKPLTYFQAPTTEKGIRNTLTVYVNGILWKEVNNFFGMSPQDQVYIVRQDEASDSYITFGDGIRGQRLDTGVQVIASYRFGAGAASPPSGSITQIATPLEGLRSVHNPIAASGGADAESAESLRENAPSSALVLGRIVSISDMVAEAMSISGVRRAQAEWRWDKYKQRPVVTLWYIGEDQLEITISERLRRLSDPNTPLQVNNATPLLTQLTINLKLDGRYIPEDVIRDVRTQLIEQPNGLLRPENQAIGAPFYRSQIFKEALKVPGTIAVSGVFWNKKVLKAYAKKPKAGYYYDFEKGGLNIVHDKSDAI